MNTSAIGATLKEKLSRTIAAVRQLPRQIFGNVSYRPPIWFSWISTRWQQVERARPRLVALTIIGLFLIACGSAWTWNWYQHLPKPKRVSVKVQPVEITKLEKELKYSRLVIYFSEPAKRPEL